MTEEDLSYCMWKVEQEQIARIRESVRQAKSRRLVPHSIVAKLFNYSSKSRMPETVKVSWSDSAIEDLRLERKYMDKCTWGDEIKDCILDITFSTIELIAKHPDIGRSGLVEGTKQYGAGEVAPIIVYRKINKYIQILGRIYSRRKRPHMKAACA